MPKPSSWRAAGDELLASGPVSRADLVLHMMAYVPPHLSSRTAIRTRSERARQRGGAIVPQGESHAHGDMYETGARRIAWQSMNNALRNGTWAKVSDGRIALRGWSE